MKTLALSLCLLASVAVAQKLKDGTPAQVKADFDLICNAVKKSGAEAETDKSLKATKVATYMLKNIKTAQALKVMQDMASELPENRAQSLKDAAKKGGYAGACPFADEK